MGEGAVNLSDRGGRDRPVLKELEPVAPVPAPIAREHRLQLLFRHRVSVGAQATHDFGEFGRKDIAGIHRDQLAKFHRRAAQFRELVGNPPNITGRQEKFGQPRALAGREPAGTFQKDVARKAACQTSEPR
uniref:Na(+)-translocating NADH-quinone reductase subunit A n=1 Tax=Fulvimarina pelagi TaxID=217511 RepID=A0A0P0ZA69_9HYPH|nr:Na(+)-translocating NADH-quinone reductase subunit A [Fulvimarina pelagi]